MILRFFWEGLKDLEETQHVSRLLHGVSFPLVSQKSPVLSLQKVKKSKILSRQRVTRCAGFEQCSAIMVDTIPFYHITKGCSLPAISLCFLSALEKLYF